MKLLLVHPGDVPVEHSKIRKYPELTTYGNVRFISPDLMDNAAMFARVLTIDDDDQRLAPHRPRTLTSAPSFPLCSTRPLSSAQPNSSQSDRRSHRPCRHRPRRRLARHGCPRCHSPSPRALPTLPGPLSETSRSPPLLPPAIPTVHPTPWSRLRASSLPA